MHLTSAQNPRIKEVIDLRDKRTRDRSQKFLIEGYREISRAVQTHVRMDTLFVCRELFLGENEEELIHRIENKGTPVVTCAETVFRKIAYRDRPDGLLAVAPQHHLGLADLEKIISKVKNPFLVVAEAIEKPGNLGTILRSSDAAGVDALIICDACTDIFNPNVVRASVGTLFTVPVIETTSQEALKWLQNHGISIVAATPQAQQTFTQADMKGPVAIALGTEQIGLSHEWLQQADVQVSIPMCGIADSLNVAMATTLLLYEVMRQRM